MDMAYVMRLIGSPLGSTEFDGQYLQDFDFEAHDGLGEALFTPDVARAMHFDTLMAALAFRDTVPLSRPRRDDGRPNRPLTSTHWAIVDPKKEHAT